ncbi:ester cyclase [Streptomyces sp. NBC_01180]|uniref:ester cyclase n=1 Tax=Streptomyces sp. NBC_01180 TaxID=2903763 RepID=UPI003868F765
MPNDQGFRGRTTKGPVELRGVAGRNAFPDLTTTIEDVIVDGDRICYRWSSIGQGFVPGDSAYRQASHSSRDHDQPVSGGKIADEWGTLEQGQRSAQ